MKVKQKSVKDIRNLIIEKPTCISGKQPVSELLKAFLHDQRTRHVYVVDEDRTMIGSVRLNEFVELMAPYFESLDDATFNLFIAEFVSKKVSEIMGRDFLYLKETTPLSDMISLMLDNRVNELPVVDEKGQIIGEVNFLELVKFLSDNESIAVAYKKSKGEGNA